jgi:imidazolonepropionase-like amidohydrolase
VNWAGLGLPFTGQHAARLLGVEKERGSIAPGMAADRISNARPRWLQAQAILG